MKLLNVILFILLFGFISFTFLFTTDFAVAFPSVLNISGFFIGIYGFHNYTFFRMNFQSRKYLYEFQYKVLFSFIFHFFYFICFVGGYFFLFPEIVMYLMNCDLNQVYSSPLFFISIFSLSIITYLVTVGLLNRMAIKPSKTETETNEKVNS